MNETAKSPYDYKDDEARLKALESEISQAEASLENDFASFASKRLDDANMEELFYEDKEAFVKQILQMQNEFLKGLQDKVSEANELRGQIGQKKALSDIEAAAAEFDNQGLGVDSDTLLDYFQNDLTPREKGEFENLNARDFFAALAKKYLEGKGKNQNEPLPQRLNASSASIDGSEGGELITQRF